MTSFKMSAVKPRLRSRLDSCLIVVKPLHPILCKSALAAGISGADGVSQL